MSRDAKQSFAALAAGMLFGTGLVIARATEPAVVLGFLDWFGAWNPSLLAMMAGAVFTHSLLHPWIVRRERPRWTESFALPARTDLDARLIGGAALFGIGWGLGGYCPGPSVVALASGRADALVVLGSIGIGTLLAARFERRDRAHLQTETGRMPSES
jgi:uncharacterized membrane protein YedE/YeeE